MRIANDNVYSRHFPALCGSRILLVEDEPLIAMLFEEELLGAGAKVIGPASSVEEALQLIEAAAPGKLSAGVLDIKLGKAAVSPVADRLAALGVPFVFATAYGTDWDRGLHAAAPVLAKPFSTSSLVAVLGGLTAAKGEAPGGEAAEIG